MQVGEATVDLEHQVVAFDGKEMSFEINPEVRERLLAGLDEIGLTLEHVDEISQFEEERQEMGATTTKI
jgi:3-isopropylmalate/(R)-2-methylmalate dehydratase small subunit